MAVEPNMTTTLTAKSLPDNAAQWKQLSQQEREARVRAAMGQFASSTRTVDDFLRDKHAETEIEDR
jgi:hypothetical protein